MGELKNAIERQRKSAKKGKRKRRSALKVFFVIAIIFLQLFFLTIAGAMVGHTADWGNVVMFNKEDVVIEPDIPCLDFNDEAAQAFGNYIFPSGCYYNVSIGGSKLDHCCHKLHYEDKVIRGNINGIPLKTDKENDYIINFPVEYEGDVSIVTIPLYIENTSSGKTMGILFLFSPTIALLLMHWIWKKAE